MRYRIDNQSYLDKIELEKHLVIDLFNKIPGQVDGADALQRTESSTSDIRN